MRSKLLNVTLALSFGAAACGLASAQEIAAHAKQDKHQASLKSGDKAPALSIEQWVKGAAVNYFDTRKVYLVEFWATWCGPCIASMPHLSEIQKEMKSKGVTVIGVTSADQNNPLAKLESMVKDKGDGMGYTVAWDT